MLLQRGLAPDGTSSILIERDGRHASLDVASISELLQVPAAHFVQELLRREAGDAPEPHRLLAPVDGSTEVWASGVTYQRSRLARMEESSIADAYSRVYDHERPELFFKSVAWRVVGPGDPIGIRVDSELNVPEPEIALVLNRFGELVGVTICNDVSSRSIEGENPLYLPQAKIYAGACALGPGIVPVTRFADLAGRRIQLSVQRGGSVAYDAATSTDRMHRRFEDLASYLFRADRHPSGVVLSTGTGIVPDLDFTLQVDDVVTIAIDGIGQLVNTVQAGTDAFSWLVSQHDSAGRPA